MAQRFNYWVVHPQFGATGVMRRLLGPVVNSSAVAWLTWSVMALELALALAVFSSPSFRRALLLPALLFHLAIACTHGLLSFSLAMWSGLVIYSGVNPRWPFGSKPQTGIRHFEGDVLSNAAA